MGMVEHLGRSIHCREDESLLDALLRTGATIDFSCKSGVCRRCLVKVVDGTAPIEASGSLPPHLRSAGYVLACQCRPVAPLKLAPKSPADMLTQCMLLRCEHRADGASILWFETATELVFFPGQSAHVFDGPFTAPVHIVLTGRDDTQGLIKALVANDVLPWAACSDALFGVDFQLRGPFPVEPESEALRPPTDPALWHLLDEGRLVRQVLEAFYEKVYADPLLQPFFERVSKDRVIGKQYSFLRQCMTGDNVYIGERPKNAHHWMVIPDSLFDHRQRLMDQAQREHGLTPEQMAGWARYEEHFRADIVKYAPWSRRMGDQVVDTERYDTITLDNATVCDHCGAEIAANSTVRFHKRLGQVGCERCERG